MKKQLTLPLKGGNEEIDGFKRVVDEMIALKTRKAGCYGNTWKIFGLNGMLTELGRKFSRIWINKNRPAEEVDFETLRDSLIDNAVYSIMAIQLMDSGETEDQVFKLMTQ